MYAFRSVLGVLVLAGLCVTALWLVSPGGGAVRGGAAAGHRAVAHRAVRHRGAVVPGDFTWPGATPTPVPHAVRAQPADFTWPGARPTAAPVRAR